jgi:hypothetical protein
MTNESSSSVASSSRGRDQLQQVIPAPRLFRVVDPFQELIAERRIRETATCGCDPQQLLITPKPSCRRRNRQPVRSSGGRVEATTGLEWAT